VPDRFGSGALRSLRDHIKGEEVMNKLFHNLVCNEEGQDLIEYALLAGFISLVAVLAITNVGVGVNAVYNNIDTQVKAIPGGGS
jgi:pilus assembly protein Flp/PilA